MLLESRALAGRKRNGLILSTFGGGGGGGGGGGAQSEEDEEDSRGLLGRKMQAEGTTAATTAVSSGLSGCTRDEGDDSSSQSPNGSLLNNINNNCNSNRQCATDFSIAAIMARDSRHQQQQQQPVHQNHHHRHSQQQAVGGGKLHQHGELIFVSHFLGLQFSRLLINLYRLSFDFIHLSCCTNLQKIIVLFSSHLLLNIKFSFEYYFLLNI